MDPLLYASLTRQTLSETLGGGNFAWPDFVAGGSLHLGLRFSSRRDGNETLRELDVVDAYAAVGSLDARPVSGTARIRLGEGEAVPGANTTAPLGVADLTAAGLVAALTALSEVGAPGTWPAPTAVEDHGTVLLVFPGASEPVPIALVDNGLLPVSLMRVATYEAGGEIVHAVRFLQSPAAFAPTYEPRVPLKPAFVRVQAGGEEDGMRTPEIQALVRPREFAGAFQIVRDSIRSAPLSRGDGPAQIKAAADPLADEDGYFTVTNPLPSEAWLTFDGAMAGQAQALLGIHVPRAPGPDLWLKLDFDHADFFGLLREKDSVEAPLHVRVLYRDEVNADTIHTADWIQTVRAKRGLHWAGLETKPGIDFLVPGRRSYVPTAVGAILTGNQHLVAAFPESGDVGADEFVFTHELESEDGHFAVRVNETPGPRLVEGIDYRAAYLGDSQFSVKLLPGGIFGDPVVNAGDPTKFNLAGETPVPALGYLSLTYTTAGPRSAFVDHQHPTGSVLTLDEKLSEIFARLLAIEGRLAGGSARAVEAMAAGAFAAWEPERVEIAYPLSRRRRARIDPWPPRLADLAELRHAGRPLLRPRTGSLLPAVHDAAAENLSALSPAYPALGDYTGRVFENDSGLALAVPGRGGREGDVCAPGGHLACDGNAWYVVEKQESRTGPDPLAPSTEPSSSEVPETWAVEESTWYPRQFVFELFAFSVPGNLLIDKRILDFPFAFEAALLRANTKAQIVLEVAFGRRTSATAPGTPGENLEAVEWTDPCLVQRIDLGGQPQAHTFGLRVSRERDASAERGYRLRCEATRYGAAEVAAPPADADFWVRGRLLNFDTLDAPATPTGILAVSGLSLPESYALSAPPEGAYGVATVKR